MAFVLAIGGVHRTLRGKSTRGLRMAVAAFCHALASSSAFPVLPCANVLCRWFRFVPNRETRIETRDVALKGSDESVRLFAVSEKRIGMAPGYSKRGVSPS